MGFATQLLSRLLLLGIFAQKTSDLKPAAAKLYYNSFLASVNHGTLLP